MRRGRRWHRLCGPARPPAAGAGNLYVPQINSQFTPTGAQLSQFAIGAGGSLTDLPAAALSTDTKDIAITPDGRFAYVTYAAAGVGQIFLFARAAGGEMTPVPAGTVAVAGSMQGIVVNPQGTRVYVVDGINLRWFSIDATTGFLSLGGSVSLDTTGAFVAMNGAGTHIYVSEVGRPVGGQAGFMHLTVDPATGVAATTTPPSVAWPAGGTAPTAAARMTISPDGTSLYGTSGQAGRGYALFTLDATGALTNGVRVGPTTASYGTSVVALPPERPVPLGARRDHHDRRHRPVLRRRRRSAHAAGPGVCALRRGERHDAGRDHEPRRQCALHRPERERRRLGDRGRRHGQPAREPSEPDVRHHELGRRRLAVAGARRVVHGDAGRSRRGDDVRRIRVVGSRRHDRPLRLGFRRRDGARKRRAGAEPRVREPRLARRRR